MSNKIVVAIDGSSASLRALTWALCNYTVDSGVELVVAHCYHQKDESGGILGNAHVRAYKAAVAKRCHSNAQRVLDTAVALASRANRKIETVLRESPHPRHSIVQLCLEIEAISLVMASKGKDAVDRVLLGSFTDYCVYHAGCPVTVVPPAALVSEAPRSPQAENDDKVDNQVIASVESSKEWHEEPDALTSNWTRLVRGAGYAPDLKRRLIVAMDGSEPSEAAFRWAMENLARPGDEVEMVACLSPAEKALPFEHFVSCSAWGLSQEDADTHKDLETALHAYCDTLMKVEGVEDRKMKATIRIVDGDARDVLTQRPAKENNEAATVLVLGSRGRGAVKRLLLGSTSDYCLHHPAHGATLVVR